jgi:hypothetical protein
VVDTANTVTAPRSARRAVIIARVIQDDDAVRRLREAVTRLRQETSARQRTNRTHDDADETVGTVATDDAVGFDPFPLLRALDRHGAEAVVMGQVAGILHGSRELTGDLDLLWTGDTRQARAFAAAFASLSAALTDDDARPLACDPAAFALPKVQFRTTNASGDCCTPSLPWGDLPITDFLSRARTARADDFNIRYLDRADLIRMRRAAGRPKDLRRAAELDQGA